MWSFDICICCARSPPTEFINTPISSFMYHIGVRSFNLSKFQLYNVVLSTIFITLHIRCSDPTLLKNYNLEPICRPLSASPAPHNHFPTLCLYNFYFFFWFYRVSYFMRWLSLSGVYSLKLVHSPWTCLPCVFQVISRFKPPAFPSPKHPPSPRHTMWSHVHQLLATIELSIRTSLLLLSYCLSSSCPKTVILVSTTSLHNPLPHRLQRFRRSLSLVSPFISSLATTTITV